MKKNIFLITLITIFSLFLASCVKEGPVVPAGADGQDGTNGTNGNANVTTTIFTNVVWQSVDTKTKMATITVPTINQDIVNKGTVLVAGSPDQQDWYAFPRDYAPNLSWYFSYKINVVYVVFHDETGTLATSLQYPNIKVTVIAGTK